MRQDGRFRLFAKTRSFARPVSGKMASTGMEADDSRPASQATPPTTDTSNKELCELCLQALTINDELAGGTTRVNTSDGTTTLDVSGFTQNNFITRLHGGFRQKRSLPFPDGDENDASGWSRTQSPPGPYNPARRYRRFCAGDRYERLVTLPSMPEISTSAVGACCFCSRLRALFIDQYAEKSWWNEDGSTLSFTIQYEWTQHRIISDAEDETTMPPPNQSLKGLAVIVNCPDRDSSWVDVYQFDVVAWPGTSYFGLS